MLRIIGDHSGKTKGSSFYYLENHQGPFNCKIYDARNYMAALGNKFAGKGFEY